MILVSFAEFALRIGLLVQVTPELLFCLALGLSLLQLLLTTLLGLRNGLLPLLLLLLLLQPCLLCSSRGLRLDNRPLLCFSNSLGLFLGK